jgi:hypothetical protein
MVRQARYNNTRDPGHACASFNRCARCSLRRGAIL